MDGCSASDQTAGSFPDHARRDCMDADGGRRKLEGEKRPMAIAMSGSIRLDAGGGDHPFGKAVSKRAAEGGGWLTWVVSVDDVSKVEARLGRQAVDGHRTKPDGHDLSWKQIGVLGTLEDKQLPFFIEWKSLDHPSTDGKAIAKIVKVEIAGDEKRITDWLGNDLATALGSDVEVEWLSPADTEGESGIVAVHLMTPSGVVRVD